MLTNVYLVVSLQHIHVMRLQFLASGQGPMNVKGGSDECWTFASRLEDSGSYHNSLVIGGNNLLITPRTS